MARTGAALARADRDKLSRVVAHLAPPLVLSQALSLPGAPGPTLAAALAPDAPLAPVSVLRACINDASTAALVAAAMQLDATEVDSASLLRQVDDFQRTLLALLDDLERRDRANGARKRDRERESEDDDDAPPSSSSKHRRYMLHRTLATGVDLFTSSAILSDQDLEALAELEDTDLIAVHPPPPSAAPPPSPPKLSDAAPAAAPPPFPAHVPPAARFGRAPGLHSARLGPVDPLDPARQPTQLLSYSSPSAPFLSSLAPTHDSNAASEPYSLSAARAWAALRGEAWEARMLRDGEGEGEGWSERESETLRELGVDPAALHPEEGEEGEGAEGALRRNVELIKRVGRAQVVRARRAVRTLALGEHEGRDAREAEEEEEEEEEEEGGLTVAGRREREDAAALLRSLTHLISTAPLRVPHPSSTRIVLPPAAHLSALRLPRLILAARAREPNYAGTLDEGNYRAVRARTGPGAGVGAGGQDLKVE